MHKLLTTLFALLAVSALSAQVQEERVAEKLPHQERRFTVATQPLYIFANGVRFDFEMRIKNTPSWIQISPSGFWLPRPDETHSYDYNYYWGSLLGSFNHIFGAGLEVNYKYFFNRAESLYLAGGLSYTNYKVEYTDEYWRSYTEDGLVYQVKELGNRKQKINKLGLNTYFGYQLPTPKFLFDMFVGLGYRGSFSANDIANDLREGMLSCGYTGVVFMTGVRFGVKF